MEHSHLISASLGAKARTHMLLRVRWEVVRFAFSDASAVKQRDLAKLKLKFRGSEDEWTAVLSHFLLQQPVKDKGGILDGVHLVYTLKDSLELSFRQDVQGIKVRFFIICVDIANLE